MKQRNGWRPDIHCCGLCDLGMLKLKTKKGGVRATECRLVFGGKVPAANEKGRPKLSVLVTNKRGDLPDRSALPVLAALHRRGVGEVGLL